MRGYFTASPDALSIHSACKVAALAALPHATRASIKTAASLGLLATSDGTDNSITVATRMNVMESSRAARRRRSVSDSSSRLSLASLILSLASQMRSSALVMGSPVSNGAMLSRAARACSSGWTPSVSAHPCLFQRATVVKCTGYPAAVIARATLRALGLFWFCQTDFANAGVAVGRDRFISSSIATSWYGQTEMDNP